MRSGPCSQWGRRAAPILLPSRPSTTSLVSDGALHEVQCSERCGLSPPSISTIHYRWLVTIGGLHRWRSVAWIANVVGNLGFDHWLGFDHLTGPSDRLI